MNERTNERRANMDWQTVRDKASLVVYRLAHSTPELRGCIELPANSIKPHHVLPIASGYVILRYSPGQALSSTYYKSLSGSS